MEQVIETEIVEFDSNKAKINKSQLNPDEIIQLDLVVDDYNKLRQIILANVAQLKPTYFKASIALLLQRRFGPHLTIGAAESNPITGHSKFTIE